MMKITLVIVVLLINVSALNSVKFDSFGLNLFKEISGNNFMISPFSISTALSMCLIGAEQETEKQIKTILNFENQSKQDIALFNKNYLSNLNKLNESLDFESANKLYLNIGVTLKQNYSLVLQNSFKTSIEQYDFSNRVFVSNKINEWVSNKTNNKIQNLLSSDSISEDTKIILINAIYFKGKWLNEFDKARTALEDFSIDKNNIKKVEMMKLSGSKFKIQINPFGLNALSCEFPYAGDQAAMTIILPNEDSNIDELISRLKPNIINELLTTQVMNQKVDVFLPKFKFESKFELSETLKKMGLLIPFDVIKANFTGMVDSKTVENLSISKIIHQSNIEVNEEGSEAAASTGVVFLQKMSFTFTKPIIFKCNRPFLFIIHEKLDNSILFIGKYSGPV